MTTQELLYGIDVLTKIVQPKINNVTFATQNKANALLAAFVDELSDRVTN